MPRLARSMDALNEITVENGTMRALGSVDNLRTKKRRTRRPRKRIQSEDDLLRREERRQERIRRERNNSVGNICETNNQSRDANPRNPRTSSTRRSRRHSVMDIESVDSGSSKDKPRLPTPNAKKRKRRQTIKDEHVTDDEDSDVPTLGSSRSIVIREFKREPRSGYRESIAERES